jgi:hypothetical protein
MENMKSAEFGKALGGFATGERYQEWLDQQEDQLGAVLHLMSKSKNEYQLMQIAGIRDRGVWRNLTAAWANDWKTKLTGIQQANGAMQRGQNILDGPNAGIERLTQSITRLMQTIGQLWDAIGGNVAIKVFAEIINTTAESVTKLIEGLQWIVGLKDRPSWLPKSWGEAWSNMMTPKDKTGKPLMTYQERQIAGPDAERQRGEKYWADQRKQEERAAADKKKTEDEAAKKERERLQKLYPNAPINKISLAVDNANESLAAFTSTLDEKQGDLMRAGLYGSSSDSAVLKASYSPSGHGFVSGGAPGTGGAAFPGSGAGPPGSGGTSYGPTGTKPTRGDSTGTGRPAEPDPETPAAPGVGGGDLSKSAYDQMFKGTPMEGKYDAVVKAAQDNGVPPSLMAGIIAHETGRGTSKMLKDKNNPAGLMDPKTRWMKGQSFPTVDEGIAAAGRTIGKNYKKAGGDVNKMAKSYAPPGAANDPKGQNTAWPSGVASNQKALEGPGAPAAPGPMASVGPPPAPEGPPGTGGGQGIGASVDEAMKMVGLNESRDQQLLMKYMKTGGRGLSGEQNAWCARFVNAVVTQAGMPGVAGWGAKEFLNWGKGVGAKEEILKGDVFVFDRGRDPRKGHVGISTGRTRKGKGGETEYEMLQGNTGGSAAGGGAIGTTWHTRQQIKSIRRGTPTGAPQAPDAPPNVASAPSIRRPTASAAPPPAPAAEPALGAGPTQHEAKVDLKVNDTEVQFARASMRRSADREVREARWNSYSDIGAA